MPPMRTRSQSKSSQVDLLSGIARAAQLVKGPWQFVALVVLAVAGIALSARGETFAIIVAAIAVPLVVFAVIPWQTLIERTPAGSIVLLIILAMTTPAGVGVFAW